MIVLLKKYIETKFTNKYISIFFIFWDFKCVTSLSLKFLIWIISLIIVSLDLIIHLNYNTTELRFFSSHTFSAFGMSYLNMFTRSSDWIFNPMRYTGYEYAKQTKFLLAAIYGSPRRHSNGSKTFKKIRKNWNTFMAILGQAESFKAMNRPDPTRPGSSLLDRNVLWWLISRKV